MHIRRSPEEIAENRARYEEHQKKGLEFAPKALPAKSEKPAPAIADSTILHREVIPGGWYWSTRVRTNEVLRIALDQGHSTVSVVAWNAVDTTERMNLPDTVKVQWTTGLGKGRVIFSDMGKVMFSIVEDSSGAHDCLMGGSTAASNAKKCRCEWSGIAQYTRQSRAADDQGRPRQTRYSRGAGVVRAGAR